MAQRRPLYTFMITSLKLGNLIIVHVSVENGSLNNVDLVSFEVGGGENLPNIPGACATRNFMYLVRGPWVLCF